MLGPNKHRPSNFTLKHVADVFKGQPSFCFTFHIQKVELHEFLLSPHLCLINMYDQYDYVWDMD